MTDRLKKESRSASLVDAVVKDVSGDAAAQMGMRDMAGPFGQALIDAAEKRPEIVAITADLSKYTDLFAFAEIYPERFLNVGMAEQNVVNVACGMAQSGLVPVATTFGAFLTRRATDFILMQAALPKTNVKLVGAVPGITATFGPSHTSIDDLAAMRAIPNMVVIDPADGAELGGAMSAVLDYEGPVYLRQPFATHVDGNVKERREPFQIGKNVLLRQGADVGIVAMGFMVGEALAAADELSQQGIEASVLKVSTVKPFESDSLLELAATTRALVTAENHSVVGGLNSLVSETLAQQGNPARLAAIGVPQDRFPPFGSREYVQEQLGMTPADIARSAYKLLGA